MRNRTFQSVVTAVVVAAVCGIAGAVSVEVFVTSEVSDRVGVYTYDNVGHSFTGTRGVFTTDYDLKNGADYDPEHEIIYGSAGAGGNTELHSHQLNGTQIDEMVQPVMSGGVNFDRTGFLTKDRDMFLMGQNRHWSRSHVQIVGVNDPGNPGFGNIQNPNSSASITRNIRPHSTAVTQADITAWGITGFSDEGITPDETPVGFTYDQQYYTLADPTRNNYAYVLSQRRPAAGPNRPLVLELELIGGSWNGGGTLPWSGLFHNTSDKNVSHLFEWGANMDWGGSSRFNTDGAGNMWGVRAQTLNRWGMVVGAALGSIQTADVVVSVDLGPAGKGVLSATQEMGDMMDLGGELYVWVVDTSDNMHYLLQIDD